MSKFLIISSRFDNGFTEAYTANDIAIKRLEIKRWPLYKNTPHRKKISINDNALIYISGNGINSQCFIADVRICGITDSKHVIQEESQFSSEPPISVLLLDSINIFKRPVYIRSILNTLDFIPKSTIKWGCVMQRGLKIISDKDYTSILQFV